VMLLSSVLTVHPLVTHTLMITNSVKQLQESAPPATHVPLVQLRQPPALSVNSKMFPARLLVKLVQLDPTVTS